MNRTKIEWATTVWNPVTGCTKISEGCKNCYAEGIAKRFWGERKFTSVWCHKERLSQPSKLKGKQRIFVNSMSDLFHLGVPMEMVEEVWAQMMNNPQHTFMILTKRADRMAEAVDLMLRDGFGVLPNVWLGVSVENQKTADERIPLLLQTPAAVRFVSCEPLLGPVDLGLLGTIPHSTPYNLVYQKLNWVICGGESGTRARPMHPNWVRSIRDQCQEANVPFFFKQWGEWQLTNEREEMKQDGNERLTSIDVPGAIGYNKAWFRRVGKKNAGRVLDGRTWDEYPQEVEG
jgi:protein gp37